MAEALQLREDATASHAAFRGHGARVYWKTPSGCVTVSLVPLHTAGSTAPTTGVNVTLELPFVVVQLPEVRSTYNVLLPAKVSVLLVAMSKCRDVASDKVPPVTTTL